MTAALLFSVTGIPAPQGSKRGFVNRHTGRVAMVESSSKVKPWREAVKYAALEAMGGYDVGTSFAGPVRLHVTFTLARPKGHSRTGRNAHLIRDGAPRWPAGKPDLDKLVRSTCDALGDAGVWRDDAQVVVVGAVKRYARLGDPVGAAITVTEATS